MTAKSRKLWDRIVLIWAFLFIGLIDVFLLVFSNFMNSDLFLNAVLTPLPVDDVPPTIVLKGPESLQVALGSKYEEIGVEASDIRSETTLVVEGEVDTSTEGEYTITYTATDEHDNQSVKTRTIKVVKPTGKIYLTFDDGPGPYTSKLLDVLKSHNVLATFFVTGNGSDEDIRREFDDGHAIGLHTYSHNYSYIYSNTNNFWDDMNRIQARVKAITGKETFLMRFPGGSSNLVSTRYDRRTHIMSKLVNEASEHGFTYFDWNVLSGDAGETTDTEKIFENVISQLKPDGDSIVLQHDVKDFSVNAVEKIIDYGLEHGYVFDKLNKESFPAHHGVNN